MELLNILEPSAVKVAGSVSSKKRLFLDIGEIAQSALGLDREAAVTALQDRENLGPTGVGKGVALPHARLPGLTSVAGAFLRLEKPLGFDSADRQPVDLIFVLFAPTDGGVDHLKALAAVSRTMRNEAVCAKLRANSDPAALHAILTDGTNSEAA